MTYVATNTFAKCASLATVNLNKVEKIGNDAFKDCVALTSVDLGEVTEIGAFAFARCTALQTIDLSGVVVIKNDAFHRCSALTSITVDASLKALEDSAFFACNKEMTVNGAASVNLDMCGILNSAVAGAGVAGKIDSTGKVTNNKTYEDYVEELKEFEKQWAESQKPAEDAETPAE